MKIPDLQSKFRSSSRRSSKLGTGPGNLVHVGHQKVNEVRAQLMRYNSDDFHEEIDLKFDKPIGRLFLDNHVQWLNLHGIHDVELITKIGAEFDIDRLILEDLLDTTQRPKVEEFPNCLFFTLKSVEMIRGTHFQMEQISFILTSNAVISLQEKPADIFSNIRERLRNKTGLVRDRSTDYLLYLLLDAVVDHYFLLLESFESSIEELEDEVIGRPGDNVLIRTEHLKRSLVIFRKSVNPLRDAVNTLHKGDSKFLSPETGKYFSDLKDSALEVIESADAYRQTLDAVENLYLSTLAQKNNDVMKVLTIIATIFIPLTFVVGVYGMNFEYMPELGWKYGYLATWIIMVGLILFMIRYFRVKGWF